MPSLLKLLSLTPRGCLELDKLVLKNLLYSNDNNEILAHECINSTNEQTRKSTNRYKYTAIKDFILRQQEKMGH
jgi:hypothetical protein